jgi:DNA ligase-1
MSIVKPMLATAMSDYREIRYPLLASAKLDGIRCLIHPALGPVTRKFKPVPNRHIRDMLNSVNAVGFDGELVSLNPDGTVRTFNECQSDIMSEDKLVDFKFLVFDDFTHPTVGFRYRYMQAQGRCRALPDEFEVVIHSEVGTPEALYRLHLSHMNQGYEGTMTRDPHAPYKNGRSTLRQEWLLKLKDFKDAEGEIIGFEERMSNRNTLERDEVGHAKRSSAKAGLVPADTLGSLVLHTDWGTLSVGTGFDDALRAKVWRDRDNYLGRLVTFTYQPSGMQDKPRFPVFKGFRDRRDT